MLLLLSRKDYATQQQFMFLFEFWSSEQLETSATWFQPKSQITRGEFVEGKAAGISSGRTNTQQIDGRDTSLCTEALRSFTNNNTTCLCLRLAVCNILPSKSSCAPSRRTQANQATTRQLRTAQIMRLHKESLPISKRSQLQIKGIVQVLLSGVAQGTRP